MPAEGIDFDHFVRELTAGQKGEIRGVYAPGVLALPVVPQPRGNYAYVTQRDHQVTLFQSAEKYGVIGLLAHNYLAGGLFFQLAAGQEVSILYGDGMRQRFQVSEISRFRKLNPRSITSDLIDLDSRQPWGCVEAFDRFYTGEPHVTFQTCISEQGNPYFGLIFIVAARVG
jgi:hypothetical protein